MGLKIFMQCKQLKEIQDCKWGVEEQVVNIFITF